MSFSLSSILSPPEQQQNLQGPPFVRNMAPRQTIDLTAPPPPTRHRDDRFYQQSAPTQHHPHFHHHQQLPPHPSASCLNSEAHNSPQGYRNSTSSNYGDSSPLHNFLSTANHYMDTQSQPNLQHMNRQLPYQTLSWSFPPHNFQIPQPFEETLTLGGYDSPNISQEGFSSIEDLESSASETEAGSLFEEDHSENLPHPNESVNQAPHHPNTHFGYGSPVFSGFLDLTNPSANPANTTSTSDASHNHNMPASTTRTSGTTKRSFAEIGDDADPSATTSSNSKRRRTSQSGHGQNSANGRAPPPRTKSIEEIDLVAEEEEEENALAQALAKQRAEAVKAQQQHKADDENKSKLSMLQCTVCLDVTEDLTATTCGHTFCRSCLLNWLMSSEREAQRRTTCPACRKPLKRGNKGDIIPLEIMKKRVR